MPELTFILDVPVEVGLERAARRRGGTAADRFENESIEFHAKLREAYRALAEREPGRCILVDAEAAKEKTAARIWGVVKARLAPAPRRKAPEKAAP
jgi:dTMP kinase